MGDRSPHLLQWPSPRVDHPKLRLLASSTCSFLRSALCLIERPDLFPRELHRQLPRDYHYDSKEVQIYIYIYGDVVAIAVSYLRCGTVLLHSVSHLGLDLITCVTVLPDRSGAGLRLCWLSSRLHDSLSSIHDTFGVSKL